jgi:hypothetical protein
MIVNACREQRLVDASALIGRRASRLPSQVRLGRRSLSGRRLSVCPPLIPDVRKQRTVTSQVARD